MRSKELTGVIVVCVLSTLAAVAVFVEGPTALKVGLGVLILFGSYFVWEKTR